MARVLLAEADRRIGDFIAGILAEFGHEVTICTDAAEADARIAAAPIDVVLTDAVLDGGADEALGRDWQARGIPTITLTGRALSAKRNRPVPPPLIDKPFRFADLRSVLDAVAACDPRNRPRRPALDRAA
jgi:DNA-binding response OmpR family regulator